MGEVGLWRNRRLPSHEEWQWRYKVRIQLLKTSPFTFLKKKFKLKAVFPFIRIVIYYWFLFIFFFFLYLQIIPPSVISFWQWTCLVGVLTVYVETLHRIYSKLQNQTLPRFWNAKTIPLTDGVAYSHHTEWISMTLHYVYRRMLCHWHKNVTKSRWLLHFYL